MRHVRILLCAGAAVCARPAIAADTLKFGASPGWVHPQVIPSGKPSDAPIALLLKDEQVRFDRGKTTTYSEGAVKFQNAQGLADGNVILMWQPATDTVTVNKLQIRRGDKVIDVLAGGQTFTILRRETNLDAATLDGTLTATLQPEGLQVGDIIDLATTTEHSDPVLKGHVEAMFGAWDGSPIQAAHAALSWPNDMHLQLRQTPNLPAVQKTSAGGATAVEMKAQDIQPLVPPKGAPLRFKIGRLAEATDFGSWSDLANLFSPLFRDASAIPTSGPLHDEVERIRSASNNPKVRAEQALALVQDRVRYVALLMGQGGYVPAKAELTWSRRFGDCKAKTALLLGILHSLGIDAEPVIVHANSGDMIADRLPMVALFNHVLVRAHIGGKAYWLDGTRTGDTDINAIEVPDFGWGLPVVANANLVQMVPAPLFAPSLERRFSVDASGGVYAPAPVTIEETYRGDSAVEWNTAYSALTAAQRDEQMHDQARAYFDSFTVGSSSLQFDKAKRELRVTIKGTAKLNWKDGWSFIPNSTIGFDPDFDRPPGALHDAPLAINHPRYVKDEATIRLPAGFAAGQTPIQPVHQTLAGVEYARTETVNGDVLTVDSSERSVAPEVPYKDALAAATRLKSLYQDDVYLRMPATYGRTAADVAALGDQQPGSAKEFVQRGSQYLDAAKLENALSDFNKALEIEPKNGDALSGRALTYLWQGKYNLAQSDLTSAEAIKPPSAVLLRARGLFTEMRSQYSEAVDFYTRSLDQEPGNAFALMHRALSRSNLGQMDQAMADYNEAVQHLGNDPNTLISRAVFEAMLGRTKEATDDLAAASKTVTTPALVAARGWVAERSGDFKTALATYTELLRSNPGNAGYLVRRSESYRALGNRDQALADSDAALKAGYKGMDLRLLRANIFFQQGNRMAAAREASLATSEHPESDYAFVLAGKTYAALGMNAAAMQAFDRAIQLNPAAYVYVNRAQVRPYSDFAGQIADYDAALKLQPNMPEALTLKATALSKHGNYAEALALYDQMPRSAGNELWIVTQRAVLLAKAGRTADAAKEFAALRTKAKSPFDLNSLCWTEATAGVQLDDAVQECRDAVNQSDRNPQYVDSLGMALLKAGKLDEALATYNEAVSKRQIAESYMGRAMVYDRKGDATHARADADAARKLDAKIDDRFADYGLKLDKGSAPSAGGQGGSGGGGGKKTK